MTDWKDLLRKYVDHVGECEGTCFLDSYYARMSGALTVQELETIRNMVDRPT